ncbi:hypothetical protein [Ferruginibacter albus]|uniref:hypothetical protein n=1 Tax=Ferruginibacter albus TaxID=2875540 RepID=UPI001CC79320|nr:hypothetical protein [Ferruginibacter albus]UAY53065.1 hypothetical protein K9M53_05150 [Ferruginibacter albus]
MQTTFYIQFTIKTPNDFQSFGKFFIGNNRLVANAIFEKLKGSDEVSEKTILQLDFIEWKNNLPVNIKVLQCTLNEMGDNCKIITKEIFKNFSLSEKISYSDNDSD